MVLLNYVIEVFDLTDLDVSFMFGIMALDRRRIGAAFCDRTRTGAGPGAGPRLRVVGNPWEPSD
jgi:hypothetical protein